MAFDARNMWQPANEKTAIDCLREKINTKYDLSLNNYTEFHRWSCDHYDAFWEEVWHFTNVVNSHSCFEVVDKTKPISEIPQWFAGSYLNYAENLLRYDDDRVAIYATSEGQNIIGRKTFSELRQGVARMAAAMKAIGIHKGDRVAGYIPNCTEAVEAMLAAASIGAIWSSTSPDFGVVGVLERFSQIKPKLIFSVNAVYYNGRVHPHADKVAEVVEGLNGVQKVVIFPFVKDAPMDITQIKHCCTLDSFLLAGLNNAGRVPELKFEQVPFSHPLFIMYSSGTTGIPKCIVHSVGGTLLKHLEEHVLQGNMSRDDVMLYYTTAGWMMWNWMVSVLAVGASIVLYDGSPLVPDANILWDLVDTIGVTILGTGAKWLTVLEDRGARPATTHRLTSLKAILSTGSPLKPASYDYVYTDIKRDVLLASITGGTDIIACFMGHNWTMPVHRGQIQCMMLGCDMETWNDDGVSVSDVGGEMVCLKPFPSMPVCFWNDPGGKLYRNAYFSKFEGVWTHGDYCSIDSSTGGIVMLGRSDGTLNPNGVRFGSAEIYHIIESFKEIQDSVCVSQRSSDGLEERVVLFLKMSPGITLGADLIKAIKMQIRTYLSARHVPAIFLPIGDIPYTVSGKKVEVAVKRAISGMSVPQLQALANPTSIDLYSGIPELTNF